MLVLLWRIAPRRRNDHRGARFRSCHPPGKADHSSPLCLPGLHDRDHPGASSGTLHGWRNGTTALAAHVVTSKFASHLPLYRQTQIFAGHGIVLDRGTLGSWVARVAWWLEPLYDRLPAFIRFQPR